MNLTDSRLAQAGNEKLELAMLSFFEQFRKIYIGDQVQKSSKVNAVCIKVLVYLFHEHEFMAVVCLDSRSTLTY